MIGETTDEEGVYRFEGVPAGDYVLTVTDSGGHRPFAQRLLAVGTAPVEEFDIVYVSLSLPFVVGGH
jgi:hypothetical protein